MEVVVNKEVLNITPDYSISLLLDHLGYPKAVAVFVNGRALLLREYDNYKICENDMIRIVKPLGGG